MRPEKESIATEITNHLSKSSFVIFTDFTGLSVQNFSELRTRLGGKKTRAMVVKNTMVRHSLKSLQMPDLNGVLQGPTAIVFGEDLPGAASILKGFAKEFKKLKVKAGIMDRKTVSAQELEQIADLPPREVLQAQLLGLLMTPATQFVRLMKTPSSQMVQVLKAKSEKVAA